MDTTTIYDEADNEITVNFDYCRPYIGRREYGAPMEPDEPASWEFNSAEDEDGKEVELTDEQLRTAEEQVANGE